MAMRALEGSLLFLYPFMLWRKCADKIAGYHTAIVPAMIKLDALAYDYLRPAEDFHE
jgi:hypothetical protein